MVADENKHENMHFFGFPLINSLFCIAIALFWLDIANWRRILGNSGNFRGLLKILDREFRRATLLGFRFLRRSTQRRHPPTESLFGDFLIVQSACTYVRTI